MPVWKSWVALEQEGFEDELQMFLETGHCKFSDELVNKLHPLAMRMVDKNPGWDLDFLVETATNCLLLRKVASAFIVVLEVEDLNPPETKHELLLLFEKIRQKINHRLYSGTLPKDIEIIEKIKTDFLSGVLSHDPSVVTDYLSFGQNPSEKLYEFLRFCNRKYWTRARLEDSDEPPRPSFRLMQPLVLKKGENVEEDPFLSHCKRVEALSKLWYEQVELADGGRDFLNFVEMNDWKQSAEWLKERRAPLDKVKGFAKAKKDCPRTEVTVKSQVRRIKQLNGDVKRGPRAVHWNENKHGNIRKLIGKDITMRSNEKIESNAQRSMYFDAIPPPVSRVSSPEPFSDLQSQATDIPITQSAIEEEKLQGLDFEELVYKARDKVIKEFKVRWRHWTLIPFPRYFETNNHGCQMLTAGLNVFLDAVIREGLQNFPSKVIDWIEHLDAFVLFEIARATVLFVATLYRISTFHVVVVDEYLDCAVPMAVTFFVECVQEAAHELNQPPRARWFWRIIAQMLGKEETTVVLTLWRQHGLDSIFNIERQHWKGFSEFSTEIADERPEETQSLIDLVHADGMEILGFGS